ncbi:MAG: hypothetical protein HY673_12810 [Chloroflexi bacterium]|nr:hypothetical protein [Chloroflexota bacterium]
MVKFICFDLEGPLAPQDNAYDLMKSFPEGGRVFEVISRYDDVLTLEKREGYEPGDTLSLIVPFLVHHNITEVDIKAMANKAPLTPGAAELLGHLQRGGWQVFCASTSYQQYALTIAGRLRIPPERVACTTFPLDRFRAMLAVEDSRAIADLEKGMLGLDITRGDAIIKDTLDGLYSALSLTNLGRVLRSVKPVGGNRKVRALEKFGKEHRVSMLDWVVVGDSITDGRMLETVNAAGGLGIAFNANEYALPYATMGLASASLFDLKPILDAWEKGGRSTAEATVREKETQAAPAGRAHYQWLAGRPLADAVLQVHKAARRLVRQDAAKLG